MIPDIRIKYNGVNVRLVGFGFRKYQNVRLLELGLESIKQRLAKGIGEDDGPTKPLKKGYAIRKSRKTRRRAIRDLNLTGALLAEIKTRYADDRQAIADASTRLGRLKARKFADLLQFSDKDQALMLSEAELMFADGVAQTIRTGKNLPRAASTGRAAISNRRTYFGRTAA